MKRILIIMTTATLLFFCKKQIDKEGNRKGDEVTVNTGTAGNLVKENGRATSLPSNMGTNKATTNNISGDGTGEDVMLEWFVNRNAS